MQHSIKKGFTLLELLIVIAILAILAVATLLVLNPVELLRQARDTQRVTDIGSLNSALSLYLTTVASPYLASSTNAFSNNACRSGGGTYNCFSDRNGNFISVAGGSNATCGSRYGSTAAVTSTGRSVAGGGWLPVNLTLIPGGAPFALMPTDPSNNLANYYAYACNDSIASSTYVLTTVFESIKYGNVTTGPGAVDGGSSTAVYEIGTNPGLNGSGGGM